MDESDRLAFLERRQAATHRMFVESRAWVEYVKLDRGAHAAERQARVAAMSPTQRAARLVADPNAVRHIPERTDEERCRLAHKRVRPPPSAAVESPCHPPLSLGAVIGQRAVPPSPLRVIALPFTLDFSMPKMSEQFVGSLAQRLSTTTPRRPMAPRRTCSVDDDDAIVVWTPATLLCWGTSSEEGVEGVVPPPQRAAACVASYHPSGESLWSFAGQAKGVRDACRDAVRELVVDIVHTAGKRPPRRGLRRVLRRAGRAHHARRRHGGGGGAVFSPTPAPPPCRRPTSGHGPGLGPRHALRHGRVVRRSPGRMAPDGAGQEGAARRPHHNQPH